MSGSPVSVSLRLVFVENFRGLIELKRKHFGWEVSPRLRDRKIHELFEFRLNLRDAATVRIPVGAGWRSLPPPESWRLPQRLLPIHFPCARRRPQNLHRNSLRHLADRIPLAEKSNPGGEPVRGLAQESFPGSGDSSSDERFPVRRRSRRPCCIPSCIDCGNTRNDCGTLRSSCFSIFHDTLRSVFASRRRSWRTCRAEESRRIPR